MRGLKHFTPIPTVLISGGFLSKIKGNCYTRSHLDISGFKIPYFEFLHSKLGPKIVNSIIVMCNSINNKINSKLVNGGSKEMRGIEYNQIL